MAPVSDCQRRLDEGGRDLLDPPPLLLLPPPDTMADTEAETLPSEPVTVTVLFVSNHSAMGPHQVLHDVGFPRARRGGTSPDPATSRSEVKQE